MHPSSYVLVTGASSGIGLELARQFARHRHSLIISGRSPGELAALASHLNEQYGVEVEYLAADLQNPEAARDLYAAVERKGWKVDILATNAGLGHLGKFWEIPLQNYISILRVNVEATVGLLHYFLPPMIQRGYGRVLVTASVAGFEPGPTLAVYHASKAFALSLSESVATELEGTGVSLTALCPGATDTDFFPKADMVDTNIFQKGDVGTPADVARAAYEGLMKGDRIVVPGATNKALVFARRLLPEGTQAKINGKFYTKTDGSPRRRQSGDIRKRESLKKNRRRF